MNTKNLLMTVTVLSVILFFTFPAVAQETKEEKEDALHEKVESDITTEAAEHREKLLDIMGHLLEEPTKFQITPEQIKEIARLRDEVQVTLMDQDREIEDLKVEINTLVWEAPFNTEEINTLIAGKNNLETEREQYVASAYGKLNAILTEDQRIQAQRL